MDNPKPVTFYRPSEVAERLRCSQWWIKEQARKRRIPYCWIGGSYLFTEDHIAAIARRFEVEPLDAPPAPVGRVRRTASASVSEETGPVVRLSAHVPRRARFAASHAAA